MNLPAMGGPNDPLVTTFPRPPYIHECEMCGWAPAANITLRTTMGLLIMWRWRRVSSRWCRGCADAMYSETQARSLTQGWWGFIAPIANVVNLVRNAMQVAHHRSVVGVPTSRAREVMTPLTLPMRPRSYLRPMPILASVVAAVLAVAVVSNWIDSALTSPPQPAAPVMTGICLSNSNQAIDCADPSALFRLERPAASAAECSQAGFTETFTNPDDSRIYCASLVSH